MDRVASVDAPTAPSVAVAQCPADLDGPDARLDWLRDRLAGIESRPPDLVVLPELFECGYGPERATPSAPKGTAEPFAAAVARLSRAHGVAVLYGLVERAGDAAFNAARCIDRRGRTIGRHRKLVLPPGFEAERFRAGAGCATFPLAGFRVAILICYDVEFPENARRAALAGADLVAVPTALGDEWGVVAERVVPTRAFENGVFLAYANWCGEAGGTRYLGASRIVGPDGRELASAGDGPGLVAARLERSALDAARRRLPYLVDRERLLRTGG